MILLTIIKHRIQIRLRGGMPVARPTFGLRHPGSGLPALLPGSIAAGGVIAAAAIVLAMVGGVA